MTISPATIALRAFVWLVRDARLHPEIADIRYRAAYDVMLSRLRLEGAR